MEFKLSILGLLGLVFGALILISLTLPWVDVMLFGGDRSIIGLDFFQSDASDFTSYAILAILAIVIGGFVAVVSLLEFIGMGSIIIRGSLIVLGAMVVVFVFVAADNTVSGYNALLESSASLDFGAYVAMLGGIGAAVTGVLGITGFLEE